MNDASPHVPPHEAPAKSRMPPRIKAGAGTLAAFIATTFLSALLLFSIQPMFAKMVLPVLGGAPSVWAVALCFFQGALLAGYCYAHGLTRFVPVRSAGFAHLGLCAAAAIVLPISLPQGWSEPPAGDPSFWQLGLFTIAIGLPFVAVSANAPLLQAWFSATGHPHGRDPYFLYAASNLGSLIALMSFPFVLEPMLGLSAMSVAWTAGYGALVAALAVCFWLVRRAPVSEAARAAIDAAAPATSWNERAAWVGLAFVPSALLTAFTAHVSTDVASAPLLWVFPLSLYLLTFVLVFREKPLIPGRVLLAAHLAAILAALLFLSQTKWDKWFESSTVGVLAFVTSALVALRMLYEARPPASRLTEFYLWMSAGGVLGGLFAALVAPRIFSEIFEYPLLLALSMACRPGALRLLRSDRFDIVLFATGAALAAFVLWRGPWAVAHAEASAWGLVPFIALFFAAVMALAWLQPRPKPETGQPLNGLDFLYAHRVELGLLAASVALGLLVLWRGPSAMAKFGAGTGEWGVTPFIALVFALLTLAAWRQPMRRLAMVYLMFMAIIVLPSAVKRGDAERSYFGVYRVSEAGEGEFNILTHGTTLHGAQRIRDAEGNAVADVTPGTYYYPESPMAKAVGIVRGRLAEEEGRVGRYGVVGLGAGSLACHSKPGERWRFFEIDPVVVGIAAKSGYFTYLANCQPEADIVLGDARLTIEKEPNASFDLIIVDAFTSDAIPVHLMTVEALRLYLSKLPDKGIVVLHISNRYLDLDRVLGAALDVLPGMHGLIVSDDSADGSYNQTSSTIAVFTKNQDALDPFRALSGASDIERGKLRPWTDDYSDILGPLLSKIRD